MYTVRSAEDGGKLPTVAAQSAVTPMSESRGQLYICMYTVRSAEDGGKLPTVAAQSAVNTNVRVERPIIQLIIGEGKSSEVQKCTDLHSTQVSF
jgi:hypothetical protein